MNEIEGVFEELSADECYRRLALHEVGRLAVVGRDGPLVFPVNYIVDGKAIVFRTDAGTKLTLLGAGPVAFQVDEVDVVNRVGWSVLITGLAYEAVHWEFEHLKIETWVPGERQHWVRVIPRRVSGRNLRLPEPVFDQRRMWGYV